MAMMLLEGWSKIVIPNVLSGVFQSKSFGIASSYMEKIFSLVLVVRTLFIN